MKNIRQKLIHLHHCRGIYAKGILNILRNKPALANLYQLNTHQLQAITKGSRKQTEMLFNDLQQINIMQLLRTYNQNKIAIMTILDKNYPTYLKHIYNPPLVLFTKGDTSLLHRPALAIVGTRKANSYAQQVIKKLIPSLIEKKIVIVSGLATGVDTMAHQTTIDDGGKTIAVIGGGFFQLYPRNNIPLAHHLMEKHLIISEFPPYTRPQKWHFPHRNRIISGLSKGTVVVQAERRSGSLITADLALQEGREVFAVPGRLHDTLSEGTNHLIQQGAKLIMGSEDILNEINVLETL